MQQFEPCLDVTPTEHPLGWRIGTGCFGPPPELRRLDEIRATLHDPHCTGPEVVYAICMDVGKEQHRQELQQRMLLFGVVAYAAGRLGDEPVRSQGHVHRISQHSGWSPPEVYEIWRGQAVILMQEQAADDPGRCFAVEAGAGDVVVVPPGWAHATISADPAQALAFGAWCDREYGFEYAAVRERSGLAWFPRIDGAGLDWVPNAHYRRRELIRKRPRHYSDLGIDRGRCIYGQFETDPARFQWVSRPELVSGVWQGFEP